MSKIFSLPFVKYPLASLVSQLYQIRFYPSLILLQHGLNCLTHLKVMKHCLSLEMNLDSTVSFSEPIFFLLN